jgi:DNA repair/transcription protein MET18/MMS19
LEPAKYHTPEEARQLILSTYILASIRKDVPLPYDLGELLSTIISVSQASDFSIGTRAAALQHLGLYVNKFIHTGELAARVQPILNECFVQLSRSDLNAGSIRVLFWTIKALILRNAPLLHDAFPSLVNALADTNSGLVVAHGFATLLQPDEILTRDNHCTMSPLHRQKTFAVLVPDIVTHFKGADKAVKKNYLIALSGILSQLPYSVFEPEIGALGPVLLQTLDIDGEYDIKTGTIETLTSILTENPGALEEHAGSLITRFLNIASSTKDPALTRSKALQGLALIPLRMRMEIALPYRRQVVQKLGAALDDRKRAVRADAVRCRTRWIELDEPEVDE